ncbi:Solitary outer membrane autotransporter beta-barrel domain [Hydrogenovibrio kuenenii]|uniref:Solitary outer membrane autotransporter beta-barrel domain n=1 Tax=Hydrogenovibrio kuenenii TaxID=63658 RepID=UPI000463EEF2|nr:Solitary outer membrane autotransporter beta-barrel domain [Hydrogenovibrio kuenenii]
MPQFLLLVAFLLLTYNDLAHADTIVSDEIQRNLAATTGIITFLTSQESVSTGSYAVEKTDNNSPSSSFSTFKIPYRKTYGLHSDSSKWSMLLGYGRFDMNQQFEVANGTTNSSWQANSLSAGIGYSKNLNPDVRWFSTLELAYSRIHHHYTVPTTTTPIDYVHFDWKTNTLSVIPALGLRFPILPRRTNWLFETKAVYLFTESVFAKSGVEDVSSRSGLWSNKIDFGEPWKFSMNTWGIAINPQFNRTDAYGKVQEALSTNYWYEANLNFRLKSYEDKWWNNLTYGFSYLQGRHFRGGQLSISFNFDNLIR